ATLALERVLVRAGAPVGLLRVAHLTLDGLAHEHVRERAVEAVLDHRVRDLAMPEAVALARAEEEVRDARHALGAAREHDLRLLDRDRLRREGDRLQAAG